MRTIEPLEAVFFDFDGVIAASLETKLQAFAALFAPYGEAVCAQVLRYHRDHGGMPRREKLRHCLHNIAGQRTDEAMLIQMAERFSALVVDGVIAAPLMPGAMQTLNWLKARGIPCFIVSGAPEEEMRYIIGRKGLESLFTSVHGSPEEKKQIILALLDQYGYTPQHCLFLGDALIDYQAAINTGLHFLGIVPQGKANIFPPGTKISVSIGLWGHPAWEQWRSTQPSSFFEE